MSFSDLRTLLKDKNYLNIDFPEVSGLYNRIFQIISKIKIKDINYSKEDLASLIRNILLFESYNNNSVNLTVPNDYFWPSEEMWKSLDILIMNKTSNSFTLEPKKWRCSWLRTDQEEFFYDVYSQKVRKPNLSIKADPSYKKITGFDNYSSSGQRDSIRSSVFMDSGASIIVNLPTGSGKSMAGFINDLLNKEHLTVFIVPTVALAIDQERQFKHFSKEKNKLFAWHSGLSNMEKESIKNNIRNGTQRIIFTSPEAVCTSLSNILIKSAESKYLRYFVIDECHLIAQWGDTFRPEFQSISGMRKLFLKKNPDIRTILMSATITDETLSTLETLFDLDNPPKIVSSVFLRGEPQYLVHKVSNEEEKFKKILELIKFGPRPYILYFNEPKEVEKWVKKLRGEGYIRVEGFHGKTKNNKRVEIIEKWNKNELDGIVATSAFGVGMDKQDIRMIIHGTVPESLDRFYQEVGRAGRDGKSSISITIFTEYDYVKSRRLSDPRVITEESGIERWKNLVSKAKSIDPQDPDLLVTDLSLVPPHLSQESDANNSWNLRTILLLVRAKFIKLEAKSLEIDENLTEEEKEKIVTQHFNNIYFRIINPNHLDSDEWKEKIERERLKSIERNEKNFRLLNSYLEKQAEISESLYKLYSINRSNLKVLVSKACGGCEKCIENGNIWFPPNPVSLPIKKEKSIKMNNLKSKIKFIDTSKPLFITYNEDFSSHNRKLLSILNLQLIKNYGIREICISKKLNWLKSESLDSEEKFIIFTEIKDYCNYFDTNINLPIVTILDITENNIFPEELLYLKRGLNIIFIPENIKDPNNLQRRFIDTQTNIIKFEKFKELLDR